MLADYDRKPDWWINYQKILKAWRSRLCCLINPTTASILEEGYPYICHEHYNELWDKEGPIVSSEASGITSVRMRSTSRDV